MRPSTRLQSTLVVAALCLAACGDASNNIPLAADDSPRDSAMVSEVVACSACTLTVSDSVVLGSPSDSLVPIRGIEFARDSRGNHYLFTNGTDFPILHYDSIGRFRGRLGKHGEGPGEYRMVSKVAVGAGDSAFVIEPAGAVIHVFAPDGSFGRRINVRDGVWVSEVGSAGSARLYGTSVLRGAPSMQTRLVRLHGDAGVIDTIALFAPPSGMKMQIAASEEGGDKVDEKEIDLTLESNVFPSVDGGFWALSDGNYRLEQYDAQGKPVKLFGVRIKGEPPPVMTFAEAKTAVANGRKMDPFGGVYSKKTKYQFQVHRWVDVDSNGLLWVTRQVAAPSWDTVPYKEVKTTSEMGPESLIPPETFDILAHSVLEIIDPKNGRMLARHTFPFRAMRVGPGRIGRVAANADGYLVPIVYHVEFARR